MNYSSQPSAERAIEILSSLEEQVGAENLAFWVTPNTVLTLSGARAYCDGVFYGTDAVLKEAHARITTSLDALGEILPLYTAESLLRTNPLGETYVGYDVVTQQGLEYVLAQTQLVDLPLKNLKPSSDADFAGLMGQLMEVVSAADLPNISSDNAKNDLAFGLLLGYPDKAMLGAIPHFGHRDPFESRLIDADIKGADYYPCPQPVYAYPRDLTQDPDILAHEELWSRILQDFYTSAFHKKLENNSAFKKYSKLLGRF